MVVVHVSVLGMGRMGRALAGRLVAGGHEVVVWNRTPGRADELVAAGAREAGDLAAAAAGAEVLLTLLSDDAAVREVALGSGLADLVGPDALCVDSSTVSPGLADELAGSFGRFVAMPVLGSPEAVRTGQATYLLGGDPALVARLEPVVASLSDRSVAFGSPGLALAAKLASNLLLVTGIVSLAEAFAVGRTGGLGDEDLRRLLVESPLVAPALRNRFEAVLEGADPGWWTTLLGRKDAGLAVDLAAAGGVELRMGTTARDAFDAAVAAGLADADIAAVARLFRR